FVAAAQGGVTEGLYAMGLTDMPYRDTFGPAAQAWFDRYKERYKNDPNIGAIYGHVAADLTALGLEKAGADLTLNSFVKWLESINRANVKDAMDLIARYGAESARVRAELPMRFDVPFGRHHAERLDVFPASGAAPGPAPVHVFVHGGYWHRLDKADFSFVARA